MSSRKIWQLYLKFYAPCWGPSVSLGCKEGKNNSSRAMLMAVHVGRFSARSRKRPSLVLCMAREASDMGREFVFKHGDFGPFVKRCRHKFICNACGRGFTQRLATCRSTEPGVGKFSFQISCEGGRLYLHTFLAKQKAEDERERNKKHRWKKDGQND